MTSDPSGGDDFDRLAESFLARIRKGERPSLAEYAERHPALAGQILDLFPALVEVEGLRPGGDGQTGSFLTDTRLTLPPALPERLGDYRIVREIGFGGMGVVYEAERETLRAHVALKVLHARSRDKADFRARFRNEARSAARLHHTNIVSVFDFGEHEGVLYYAMQYIAGQGLDRVLDDVRRLRGAVPGGVRGHPAPTMAEALLTGRYRQGLDSDDGFTLAGPTLMASPAATTVAVGGPGDSPNPGGPPPNGRDVGQVSPSPVSSLADADQPRYHREVARIGAEVADALAYAHGRGVLHRDIKPSNLLLDARGTAWVTDFGLAKFDGGEALTETGDVVGTLRYMSHERFEGRSDASCDIYALGATLYEMLALRPAFGASDRVVLIHDILHEDPTPLRAIDPRISIDLSTVVHKAMARDPADRFGSAAELASELSRVVARQPIRSRRIPLHEQSWRWCKRNPLVASLNALAAVLLIAIVVVSTTAAVWLKRSNIEVEKQLRNSKTAGIEKSEQLWEASVAQAHASRLTQRAGQRFDALAALGRAADLGRQLGHSPARFDILRNEAIAALALPDIHVTRRFGRSTPDIVSVDVNEDFTLYATSDKQGQRIVRRVADDAEVARLPRAEGVWRASFGHGPWIADHADGSGPFRVWDLSGPTPELRVDARQSVQDWDFRPDGRLVAVTHEDGSLTTYGLPGGERLNRLPAREIASVPNVRLHPTAPYVVVTSYRSNAVEIRHLATGETLALKPPWPLGNFPAAWSDDGRMLAIPAGDVSKLMLYEFTADPPAIRPIRSIEGIAGGSGISINQTGDRLFSQGWGGVLFMHDPNTGRELFRTRASRPITPRGFRADRSGRRLFSSDRDDPDRRFGIMSVGEGWECRLLSTATPRGPSRMAVVGPDGRLGLVASEGWLAFHDLETGREVGGLPFAKMPNNHLYISFDLTGRLLTSSADGCFRWPVRDDTASPGNILVGPPERLSLERGNCPLATSRDGSVIAQAMPASYATVSHAGSWVLHPERPGRARNLAPGADTGAASVSPDGRWLAFASNRAVTVYDAGTEKAVWTTPADGGCQFSPDARWLATDADEGRLYSVGSWKPGPQLGEGRIACISQDARTAVLTTSGGELRLVEVANGREIARIEDPGLIHGQAALSPDRTKILTPQQKGGVHAWDLRRIRAELATLGLDWDAPPFPPPTGRAAVAKVIVVGADLLDPDSTLSLARDLLATWLKGGEAGASACLRVADRLASRGWKDLALKSYDATVRRHPGMSDARLHRGLELFRRERWEEAAEDLLGLLETEPNHPLLGPARVRLAWAYTELGRPADAAAEMVRLLDRPPESWRPLDRAGLLVLRAEFYDRAGKPDLAGVDRALAIKLSPDLALAANDLAWRWLTPGPGRRPRENWRFAPAALLLARKAVELAPGDPMSRNTLGVALYRSGRPAEARATLEASLALGKGRIDAWDLFPTAMCHQRLGDPRAAQECYEKAVAWVKSRGADVVGDPAELAELQAEARRLLGLRE